MEFFRPACFVWKIEQFIFSLAQDSSCGNLAGFSPSGKAPEGWRSPRRFAYFKNHLVARQRLGLRRPSAAFSRRHIKLCRCQLKLPWRKCRAGFRFRF
jgi:hypothetical protein